MRWRYILSIIGILNIFLAVSMVFALLWGLYYQDGSVEPLLISMAITLLAGAAMVLASGRPKVDTISHKEGMAIVAVGWIAIGFFGALPFYFAQAFDLFVDACFESVSGFTTTGSTVLINIEGIARGLLFWRSQIQWLGGMGIIVLSVAILPFLGVGGMQLYKAEVPSPVPDKLKPRIRDTAMVLWKVYVFISLAEMVLLMLGGMSLFDALCHTFTTMPTGGFSPKNASIAHYDSLYIELVVLFFMMVAGVNFSLHYQFFRGKPLAFWKDSECRFFLITTALLILIVTLNVFGPVYKTLGVALRYGAFQVVSIITTTGYASADYEKWPAASQLILLLCMFVGASAGSTGGGMKCLRVMLYFKYCYRELFSLVHPHAVTQIKILGKPVPEDVMRSVLGFMGLYTGLFAFSTILLSLLGVDLVTSLAAVAATLGNVGPGLAMVGPIDNFAHIPYLGKWLLVWCMLLGRLEIYTVIILLVPEFWRR